jgi:hypothetical protein
MKTFNIHIGIHKTGSTFLQKKVFPKIESINFLSQPNFKILKGSKYTSLSKFMNRSPLVWKEFGSLFLQEAKNKVKGDRKKDILVSDEHAVEANDPLRISKHIEKMKNVFEEEYETKIVIVVRRQDTWMASAYSEMSNRYENASQSHFEKWVDERLQSRKNFYSSSGVRLKYYTLAKEIEKKVKQSNLKVIPFETLKKDPKKFIKEMCEFIENGIPKGIDISPEYRRSKSSSVWKIRPKKDRYIRLRPTKLFDKVIGKSILRIPITKRDNEIFLSDKISKRILDKYSKENKRLDDRMDVDLESYGYY